MASLQASTLLVVVLALHAGMSDAIFSPSAAAQLMIQSVIANTNTTGCADSRSNETPLRRSLPCVS